MSEILNAEILGEVNVEEGQDQAIAETPQTPADLLATLEDRLKNGRFPVDMSNKALKHVRSFLQTKATYKGQQEAIYLASAMFVVEALIAQQGEVKTSEKEVPQTYQFPSQAIQIINYFLARYEGAGYHSAETYLAMAVPFAEATNKVNTVHGEVERLKAELNPAPTEAGQPEDITEAPQA